MHAASLLAFALVGALGAGNDPAPGFKFKEGRKLAGRLYVETDFHGDDKVFRKQFVDFLWTEKAPDDDGSAKIRVEYLKLRWEQTGEKKGRVDFNHWFEVSRSGVDSDDEYSKKRKYIKAVPGAVLDFTLTRDGQVKQVHPPAFFSKLSSKETTNLDADIGELVSMGKAAKQPIHLMLPQFPGDKLAAGRKWKGAKPRQTDGVVGSTELIPTFLVKSIPNGPKDPLLLEVEYDCRSVAWRRDRKPDESYRYGRCVGEVRFDAEKGVLLESTAEVDLRYKTTAGDAARRTNKWKLTLKETRDEGE